jgi:lysophospholipase L1-like esterase
MRILVLGDSLPAPRPRHGLALEKTWPVLLREYAPETDVWQRARSRACSDDVLAEFRLFSDSLTRFDAMVIQTGIVDCAPRPYPRWFGQLVEIFATTEHHRAFERLAHRRLLWAYGRPWVSRIAFKGHLGSLLGEAAQSHPALRVLLIPIVAPTRRMLAGFPGIAAIVSSYNETLRELAQEHRATTVALDPYTRHDPLALTLDDGHHLTTVGHDLIAAEIAKVLFPPAAAPAR